MTAYEDTLLRQFEVQQSDDDAKIDLELRCVICQTILCDVESGDSMETLVSLMADHVCTSRWWVVEGDDHEQRIVEATSEDEALDAAREGFSAQYAADYSRDLLTSLGSFDSEEEAEDAYPDASS